MVTHNANINFKKYETEERALPVPPSVTLLVSLFLILITFFIVINQSAEYDDSKKDIIMKSMHNKFGMPTEEKINFGGFIAPQMEDFVVDLEKLFETNAQIKSTVNGDETTIIVAKSFFYFADEMKLRQDRMELALGLQDILNRWNMAAKLSMTVTFSMEDYAADKQRLENFRHILGQKKLDIGLDPNSRDTLKLVIRYE